jgi:hypothetical protein
MDFINAQKMAKENPNTFEAPTRQETDALKIGDHAKICNGKERFWVLITAVGKDSFTGTVDNELFCTDEYTLGHIIKFKWVHIYDFINNHKDN